MISGQVEYRILISVLHIEASKEPQGFIKNFFQGDCVAKLKPITQSYVLLYV